MSGIAGIVHAQGPADQDCVRRMTAHLAHRGPEGEGLYAWENVALGYRRLGIIDPQNGSQPMANKDKSLWIVFNGAIYNYLELRLELIARGHSFTTYTDTEVIIQLYEAFGEECLARLNGMFAFALLDQNRRRLFAARDRFGVKPFYYVLTRDMLAFASEPKALLGASIVAPEVDIQGLQDYITFQFTLGEKTLFKNIQKLEPGHCLSLDFGGDLSPRFRRWWDLHYSDDVEHSEEYFVDKLMYLVSDAVKLCLRADVPVGCCLSGGMDSSAVAALAAAALPGAGMHTFTGRFAEGPEFDESAYAREAAEKAGTTHHELTITADSFAEDMENIIRAMDEPGAGPGVFPQYVLIREAQKYVKVLMGGQGGDEIFIGYARYLVAYLEEVIRGSIFETYDQTRHAVSLESIVPNLPMLRQYIPMMRLFWSKGLFETLEQRYFAMIDRSEGVADMFHPDFFAGSGYSPFEAFRGIFLKQEKTSYVNRMSYFDCRGALPALLHVDDRTSMRFGVESRLPLLDHRIAELCASIPPGIKFKGGRSKALFRKAVRNLLPASVLARKDKMGFPVPLSIWYQGALKEYVHDILLSQKALSRGLYNERGIRDLLGREQGFSRVLWGLLCMELWHRTFVDHA